ncbi:MAG: hypothetical protein KF883_13925 [Thermomicrobiales bacterium]|nr:hypothetical protein [Thermomicrobiales bacterium]
MANDSTCASYSFKPSGILERHAEEGTSTPGWTNDEVGEQTDLAVVDIVCDGQFVAISTGRQLSVIDAESGTLRWQFDHEKYEQNVECLSRLTLVDGKVFVNRTASWREADDGKLEVCTEVRSYQLDAENAEAALLGIFRVNVALPLLAFEVRGNHLVGRSVEGSLIEVPLNLSGGGVGACPDADDEEIDIGGCGWRCFGRVME